VFLDLVQNFLFSEYEIDEKKRNQFMRAFVGVPRLLEPAAPEDPIPAWAPAWWNGDEDASASNFAAMAALKRG